MTTVQVDMDDIEEIVVEGAVKEYQDIELTCFCGMKFVWEKGEQRFMDSLFADGKIDAVTIPKRCKECRLKKKRQRELKEQREEGY